MTIALIAHDAKKELMIQFCIAYCGVLSRHKLCATGTTGKLVSEATGLEIQRYLSGRQGGDQQIAARIACDEIDVLLFFRDPINRKESEPNEMALLRLCDVHNVPVATNIATAEALIMALERGDLDWREYGNQAFPMILSFSAIRKGQFFRLSEVIYGTQNHTSARDGRHYTREYFQMVYRGTGCTGHRKVFRLP